MRGTDKTPPEPHRSYPALPSQLFELVGSRQQKEPHPPTPQATVSPAPKGALPSAITPYDVITASEAVSFIQVQESYAERSQESGIRKMPSPRHQVSSWTGSRGWCHRSLPPGWRAILVLAASHMATPLPVLPIQRGSGFSGSRDRGRALSHHRDVLGISLRSGASPVLPSRLLEQHRGGRTSEWPVRWARHHRPMVTHSTLWIGLPRHNSTTADPQAHVDSRGTPTHQQKYTSTPCVEVGAPPLSGPYSWRVTEFPAHSGCSKIFG